MKKHQKILAGLLAAAMAASLAACGSETPAEEPSAGVAVQVQTVTAGSIATDNRVSGQVSADDESTILIATTAKCTAVYVEAGDEVKAGDVLVSGELPIYDDSETLVKINKVHADAEVYARTVKTVTWKIPAAEEIRTKTGRKRLGVFFKFMDMEVCFLMPDLKKESTWELFMEEYQLRLSKNFHLPVYGGILTAKEYVPYEKVLTEAEISDRADRYLNEYMQNLAKKGIQILGSDVKIERSGSHWKIHGTLTVVEDIAKESPIPEDQEEIQTVDEHH